MFERLKWLIPALTLLAALVLLSSSSRKPESLSPSLALEVVGPVENLMSVSARKVGDFWSSYLMLVGLRQENRALLEMVAQQEKTLRELVEYKAANNRLAALLGLKDAHPHLQMRAAYVLAWEPGPWSRAVVINLGSRDGVAIGQPVVHDRGLVGRVAEVSPNYSRVLLANDFSSSIDSFIQRSRAVGILSGQGARPMAMKYVRKDEDVRPGDVVITSGLGGYFPRGLPLGTVNRVNRRNADLFMEVDVIPQVPFDRLEEVMVVMNQAQPLDWMSMAPQLRPLLEDAEEDARWQSETSPQLAPGE